MSKIINVYDAKAHFSKYLEQVAQGTEIRIGKYGKAISQACAGRPPAKKPRKPGILAGKLWIDDDFDEPMPELIAAMEEDINASAS